MKQNTFYQTFILDIIFVIAIIALVMFVRLQAQENLALIKGFIPQVGELQGSLSASNLTNYDVAATEKLVGDFGTIVNQTLLMYLLLLPLGLIIIWVLTQGLIFRKLAGTSLLRFFLYTLPFLISVFAFTVFSFDILSWILMSELFFGWGWFVLSFIAVVVLSYFGFVGCVEHKYSFNKVFIIGLNKLGKIWGGFLLFLLNAFVVYLLIALIYVFTVIDYNLILLVLITLIFLALMNWQRKTLIKLVE